MRIIFSNYFFIIKTISLLCFLLQINYKSIAQPAGGCVKTWLANGGPSSIGVYQQSPEAVSYAAGEVDIKLQVYFTDYDQFYFATPSCNLTTPPSAYISSLTSSVYDIEFSLPNNINASFSKTANELSKTVQTSQVVGGGSQQINPTVYRLGPQVVHINKEVVLSIKKDWVTLVTPPNIPPDIVVTVKIKDVTTGLPPGDSGLGTGIDDVNTVTKTFTIKYRNLCPTGLDLINTSQDNIWLSYNNQFTSCLSTDQYDGYAPYCYKATPDLLADNIPDYAGTAISEEITNRTALFQMSDIKPSYLSAHPGITNPNSLADILFPMSSSSTFTLNADDKFEDVHSGEFFLNTYTGKYH